LSKSSGKWPRGYRSNDLALRLKMAVAPTRVRNEDRPVRYDI
jgi:hypothetical protein